MASDSFKNLAIGFLLFGLISVLVITIVFEMGLSYGVDADKMNRTTRGALDIDDYEVELNNTPDTTSNFRERFESGDIDDVDDPSGVFSVAGDVIGVITTPFNVLAKVGSNIIGFPEIVIKVILSIINVVLILGIWSLLRKGD